MHLDSSELATVLAALRLFQREFENVSAKQIAEIYPDHFSLVTPSEDDPDICTDPQPLGTEDIDTLCERLNCTPDAPRTIKVWALATDGDDNGTLARIYTDEAICMGPCRNHGRRRRASQGQGIS